MPSSVCLPFGTSTGLVSASPPAAAAAASSSQLWRSKLWLGSPSLRSTLCAPQRAAFVAVDIDGTPGTEESTPAIGSRIRVSKPLRVFHVPKHPEFDLTGCEGDLKDVLKTCKGKPISSNLPYKVQFLLNVDGKQVKFFAHLKEDEFEVI